MRSVTAWRLAQSDFARSAAEMLSGDGAMRYGGRWNNPGTRIVYLSESLALAALEQLVHLNRAAALAGYRVLRVELPGTSLFDLDRADLPSDWDAHGVSEGARAIGDEWVAAGVSLALRVPSTSVRNEYNILLNPQHPEMSRLGYGVPGPFEFDQRLLATR
jgi:RES domain-containing protein